jgi:hypothetical protein
MLYMSMLVEFFIKDLIINFEKMVEGAAINFHVGFNPRNLYSKNDIENQPLGYLIKILDTYTKDKKFIQNLKHFSNVRNKCIHKLFNHEIKEVHKELGKFDRFYYDLIISLMHLSIEQMDLSKKSFGHICDDCFKKVLAQEAKL